MWDSLGSFLPNSYGGNQFGDKLLKLSNLLANPQETSFQRRIISNCNQLSLLVKNGSEKKLVILMMSTKNYFQILQKECNCLIF